MTPEELARRVGPVLLGTPVATVVAAVYSFGGVACARCGHGWPPDFPLVLVPSPHEEHLLQCRDRVACADNRRARRLARLGFAPVEYTGPGYGSRRVLVDALDRAALPYTTSPLPWPPHCDEWQVWVPETVGIVVDARWELLGGTLGLEDRVAAAGRAGLLAMRAAFHLGGDSALISLVCAHI